MEYNLTKTNKLYEQVADSLLEQIKSGSLKPGDKLHSVEQLALNYDVSRSAIREALSGLRAMGVIEMRQGQGTYVTHFDANQFVFPVASAFLMKKNDIKNLSEVRKMLEIGAVGLAALNRTEQDLMDMRNALDDMMKSSGEGDLDEKADIVFHMAIAKATKNDMVISLLSSVSDVMVESMREARRLILEERNGDTELYTEHLRIYEAIKNKNVSEAETSMLNHLVAIDAVLEV